MMKTQMVLFLSCCLLQGAVCNDSRVGNLRMDALEKNFQSLEENVKEIASMVKSILAGKLQVSPPLTQPEETQLNATVEERLTLVELQVSDLGDDLEAVEDEVTVVSAQQLLQDGRILELEIDSDGFEDSVESLIATDISVMHELTSVRQELTSVTQELTSVTQELISVRQELTSVTQELTSVRQELTYVTQELTSVNENILDLQARVQAQEVSGTIAFQGWVGQYEVIPRDSVVLFNIIDLNLGNGFDILTGEFCVPSGGSGLYYFRFGYLSNHQIYSDFYIRKNGVLICRAYNDINSSGANDRENASCAAVVTLVEGDIVDVYYIEGTNDNPVVSGTTHDNTFTGFRIAPQ